MSTPLTDQELESWNRWSLRKIDWKPEDVQRLLRTIGSLKATAQVVWVKHGTSLYRSVVELRREVLRTPLGLDFSRDELAAEASDHHLALLEGNSVLACLLLTERGEGRVQMRQVAVQPSRQHSGLGTALVGAAEDFARRLDCRELVLHARENVVDFYTRLGYEAVGDPFVEVGIPHRLMRKQLLT